MRESGVEFFRLQFVTVKRAEAQRNRIVGCCEGFGKPGFVNSPANLCYRYFRLRSVRRCRRNPRRPLKSFVSSGQISTPTSKPKTSPVKKSLNTFSFFILGKSGAPARN